MKTISATTVTVSVPFTRQVLVLLRLSSEMLVQSSFFNLHASNSNNLFIIVALCIQTLKIYRINRNSK